MLYYTKLADSISYNDIGDFQMENLDIFAENKKLFKYQIDALENILKILCFYFQDFDGYWDKSKNNKAKQKLLNFCIKNGLSPDVFKIRKKDKKQQKTFDFLRNYFDIEGYEYDQFIHPRNFFNRSSFWMATGSGKSLVLIKLIQILDNLIQKRLIPQRQFLVLLPKQDLIRQFKKQIEEFNNFSSKPIEFVNLKSMGERIANPTLFDKQKIIVYYYRSDLLQDEKKENIIDFKDYDFNGKWYIFLDEAHRGEKQNSKLQNIVTVLSRNGFLFNFSATFTDLLDYTTTCFNFNLEKFIKEGYGKNIYLSPSYFHFTKDKDEFTKKDKQKQVLKSFIVFSLIKKFRNYPFYHSPLMITLVNSVNTDDSDLLLFFEEIEKIAIGNVDLEIFNQAKEEVLSEILNYPEFIFGEEKLILSEQQKEFLLSMQIKDVFEMIFNTSTSGKIEILEGEKGKEIVLKLESADKPFALIKIGDAKKFEKEKLGINYHFVETFGTKKYFENLNEDEDINILIGSRSFYEGWDSNRPNVINLINIGKSQAKKFVLQGIGRGVRIMPGKYKDPEKIRKRLPFGDKDKNILLETLFVFATDKKSVKEIITQLEKQKTKDEFIISLDINPEIKFDLLIPVYKEEKLKNKINKFLISKENLENIRKYFENIPKSLFLLKYKLTLLEYKFFKNWLFDKENFKLQDQYLINPEKLILKMLNYSFAKTKTVKGIKKLEDEIIHFKHIKVYNFTDEELKSFKEKIEKVKNFEKINENELDKLFNEGKISIDEYKQKIKLLGKFESNGEKEIFKDLYIEKIVNHYYIPIIYSLKEKVDYIKHIITVKSEVGFIKSLIDNYDKLPQTDWMFSKIDENLDKKMGIPYFDENNNLKHYYPDFIFWIKNKDNYKIVFIDPKGGTVANSQKKIDGFKLLLEGKTFYYADYKIKFELYFIGENKGGIEYDKYWLNKGDFSFLNGSYF